MESRIEGQAVVCTNAETLCPWEDPSGNGNEDEAREIVSETFAAASAEFGPENVRGDGHFSNWHGGKYGSQAAMYGYEITGFGAVKVWRVTEDEEGDEIRERVSLRDCPEAQAACDRVDAAAEAAAKRVRAAQESE